jgi:hypothetical protein
VFPERNQFTRSATGWFTLAIDAPFTVDPTIVIALSRSTRCLPSIPRS